MGSDWVHALWVRAMRSELSALTSEVGRDEMMRRAEFVAGTFRDASLRDALLAVATEVE
jgi:hypothetical protein